VLADPAPILMYPISSTEVRVLVDIPKPLPDDLKSFLLTHTLPQLPKSVQVRTSCIHKTKRCNQFSNFVLFRRRSESLWRKRYSSLQITFRTVSVYSTNSSFALFFFFFSIFNRLPSLLFTRSQGTRYMNNYRLHPNLCYKPGAVSPP
jgi:hypothetical protein